MADGPKVPLTNKPGKTNWVEKAGGLPDFMRRIAEHIKGSNPGWSESRVIASAVSQAEKVCATGMTFGGRTKVSAAARKRYCDTVAEWKAKRAKAVAEQEKPRTLSMATLISIAEMADARLTAIAEPLGGPAAVHLLAELELTAEDAPELHAIREEVLDMAALIEAVNLPRHRDGQWTNILKRVTSNPRSGEDVMADVRASRGEPAPPEG